MIQICKVHAAAFSDEGSISQAFLFEFSGSKSKKKVLGPPFFLSRDFLDPN